MLFYGILPKGEGGGLGRSKSFESFFVCPEAIKSKQMPMSQKAKNSGKVIFEFFLKIFGKSDSKVPKSDSKVPKVVGKQLFSFEGLP